MASILDQIKRNALPAGAMRTAAKGALPVPAREMIEILVYLTSNPVFGQDARMTLAGWDLATAQEIMKDPAAPPEVLGYFWGEQNRRPALMPALIENPAISEYMLMEVAGTAPREIVQMLLESPRARSSAMVLEALTTNPRITPGELTALQGPGPSESDMAVAAGPGLETHADVELVGRPAVPAIGAIPDASNAPATSGEEFAPSEALFDGDPESEAAHTAWLKEYEAEIAAAEGTDFVLTGETLESAGSAEENAGAEDGASQERGHLVDEGLATTEYEVASVEGGVEITPAPISDHLALAAMAAAKKRAVQKQDIRKMTPLQKIARLGAAERVKLAFLGNKEERSILIRDGAKIVQNAVLASPKLTDPEVESFASAKNLQENVFREIARNRRFMKNYHVVRNLVQNPRTPLDIALPLVKMLLVYDLKGMQHSRTISETIRKMAQKYYKEKATSGGKTKD
jgi:hypothetical protein